MFGLRAPELIIILVVVLIIFGPKNLPKLGKSLGSTVKNIREGMEGDDKAETKQAEEVVVEQSEEDKEIAVRQWTATLTQSSPIPLGLAPDRLSRRLAGLFRFVDS